MTEEVLSDGHKMTQRQIHVSKLFCMYRFLLDMIDEQGNSMMGITQDQLGKAWIRLLKLSLILLLEFTYTGSNKKGSVYGMRDPDLSGSNIIIHINLSTSP